MFMLPSLETHVLALRIGRGCKALHLLKQRYGVRLPVQRKGCISSDINV
jgi:hypothetical protein